jgi:hypothetical protein
MPVAQETELELAIFDPDGEAVAQVSGTAPEGADLARLNAVVKAVKSWSPETPRLYRVVVSMCRLGAPVDVAEERFGFRTIEARNGRFYLNGEPLYLRAALDQDYYPDTICTPPSIEFLEDQFLKAKELGFNCIRCHIKVPDPRYYEVADRLGMLVWAELPNAGFSTVRSRQRKERTLKGIVDRDGNHPSIICWTLINEDWGIDLVHDHEHRAWLRHLWSWTKAYDPSRLVVDNSPVGPSFHIRTDIADFHAYAAFPDNRAAWDRFVDQLGDRPGWLFAPDGDAEQTGQEPLVCSEFGNWGLPDPADLADDHGSEPWWFETGHDWGEGVMYAHAVQNRFMDWSLDRVFGTFRQFVMAAQWQQFRALKYEIETLRRKPQIAGYVITELTDCHWESNGLLDMRRNRRVFHADFAAINTDTIIVPRWERLSVWCDDGVRCELSIAHAGARPIVGALVEVAGEKTATVPVPDVAPMSVTGLGIISIPVPAGNRPRMAHIGFSLKDRDGRVLATNHLDVAVHERRGNTIEVPVWARDHDLRERLTALGYHVAASLDEAGLAISRTHDAAIAAYVRGGGRLLLLPETEGSLYPFFPHWQKVKTVARAGTLWAGNWASSFAWLRRRGPFADFPGGPMIDETFDRVIPTHVISGCNLLDFQARVHAGLVVGWIHRPVALVVERGYGRGGLMVSTFRLFRDAPGEDPTATVMLAALLRAASATRRGAESAVNAP